MGLSLRARVLFVRLNGGQPDDIVVPAEGCCPQEEISPALAGCNGISTCCLNLVKRPIVNQSWENVKTLKDKFAIEKMGGQFRRVRERTSCSAFIHWTIALPPRELAPFS